MSVPARPESRPMPNGNFCADVWPAVQQLCIRLEANGKGELSSRIERSFAMWRITPRIMMTSAKTERFDFDLWLYGDPERADIEIVQGSAADLVDKQLILARSKTGGF